MKNLVTGDLAPRKKTEYADSRLQKKERSSPWKNLFTEDLGPSEKMPLSKNSTYAKSQQRLLKVEGFPKRPAWLKFLQERERSEARKIFSRKIWRPAKKWHGGRIAMREKFVNATGENACLLENRRRRVLLGIVEMVCNVMSIRRHMFLFSTALSAWHGLAYNQIFAPMRSWWALGVTAIVRSWIFSVTVSYTHLRAHET